MSSVRVDKVILGFIVRVNKLKKSYESVNVMNFVAESVSKMMVWVFQIGFELTVYLGISNLGLSSSIS